MTSGARGEVFEVDLGAVADRCEVVRVRQADGGPGQPVAPGDLAEHATVGDDAVLPEAPGTGRVGGHDLGRRFEGYPLAPVIGERPPLRRARAVFSGGTG